MTPHLPCDRCDEPHLSGLTRVRGPPPHDHKDLLAPRLARALSRNLRLACYNLFQQRFKCLASLRYTTASPKYRRRRGKDPFVPSYDRSRSPLERSSGGFGSRFKAVDFLHPLPPQSRRVPPFFSVSAATPFFDPIALPRFKPDCPRIFP